MCGDGTIGAAKPCEWVGGEFDVLDEIAGRARDGHYMTGDVIREVGFDHEVVEKFWGIVDPQKSRKPRAKHSRRRK